MGQLMTLIVCFNGLITVNTLRQMAYDISDYTVIF
jgi:hypothetical protein